MNGAKIRRRTSVCAILTCCVVLFAAAGCSQEGSTEGTPCGQATITGSDDANNALTELSATQCNVTLVDGVLQIDMLDRDTGDINPRVLFTLDVEITSLADLTGTIDLSRGDDDVNLAPAIYQEYTGGEAPDPAEGAFWSSLNVDAGEIVFAVDGVDTVGTFNFDADNPALDTPSTATGIVSVSGTVTVFTPGDAEATCGCGSGSAPLGMFLLLGLALMKFRTGRRCR